MWNTAAPYKVHHREHGTGKYPQQTEVIYEPIGVIGAAQYLLPGWERKRKLMTVVCQHQAEQYHRKYKNHVPVLVQRGGLPPIQKRKAYKVQGSGSTASGYSTHTTIAAASPASGQSHSESADIQPEQHQAAAPSRQRRVCACQDTPPDRYRPGKDQNIIQHRAPKAGIRHIKRPHQDSAENHPCNRSGQTQIAKPYLCHGACPFKGRSSVCFFPVSL